MINNLIFLSKGVQLAMLVIVGAVIILFMRVTVLEKRIKDLEAFAQKNYITYDDHMEYVGNIIQDKSGGGVAGAEIKEK